MALRSGRIRGLGIDFKICELIKIPSGTYIGIKYMHIEGIFLRAKIEFVMAVVVLTALLFVSQNISKQASSAKIQEEKPLIVIDAGHGGEDPGKVAKDGTKEKDINLDIANELKILLEEQGIEVKMTRDSDRMLADENAQNKKREDMKARVEIINKNVPDITVSIHQNSYGDAKAKGAQVFYYKDSVEGKAAAELIQKELLEMDEENHRQIKENNDYYLLKNTDVPVIIVECGFLSNPEEAELLITEDYKKKLAVTICEGIVTYLERK